MKGIRFQRGSERTIVCMSLASRMEWRCGGPARIDYAPFSWTGAGLH